MRKRGFGLIVLLAACSGAPRLPRTPAGSAVLEIRGAVKGGPFSLGRADLDKLPRRTLRGVDPETGVEAAWSGPSVAALVSERVQVAKGADVAVARTAAGAVVAIPLTVIRQLKPVLADRADGVRTQTPILAWPTLEQRGLETDPRARAWWVRDVVAFEISEWQKSFGFALVTPDGAPDGARRGSATFGERCMSCHRLRGAGGRLGPDLTTVASRIRADAFATLLEKHPRAPIPDGERDAERETLEVWSFLQAVAVAGSAARADDFAAGRSDRGPRRP